MRMAAPQRRRKCFAAAPWSDDASAHQYYPLLSLPTGPCPQGLRTQIVFPSCWDGKNLDSSDHQSHMSYPIDGGE